jgi:hypothetical protein
VIWKNDLSMSEAAGKKDQFPVCRKAAMQGALKKGVPGIDGDCGSECASAPAIPISITHGSTSSPPLATERHTSFGEYRNDAQTAAISDKRLQVGGENDSVKTEPLAKVIAITSTTAPAIPSRR